MNGPMWQVAFREIRERGRSKAYLITLAVTLLLVVGLIVVPHILAGGPDEVDIGVVGEGNDQIVSVAETLATAGDDPGDEPSMVITTVTLADRAAAEAALAAGDVEAVLVDGSELMLERPPGFTGSRLISLIQQAAVTVELERLVAEEGRPAAQVVALMTTIPLKMTTLTGEEAGDISRSVIAYAGLILLYVAILLYGTWILTGVTEEKSNRVVEVLLSSVKPWQLLAGKILGIGTLGILQFAGTIVVAVVTLNLTGALELPQVDTSTAMNLIVWFVLGFLLYAVMFGAAGSLVSRPEEAQNIAFPLSLTGVVGFFIAVSALNNPTGVAAVAGTFIPLTAPFVVPVRTALDAIPTWHYAGALGLTLLAGAGLVMVGGRIYAGGLLRFGRRVKAREAWKGALE